MATLPRHARREENSMSGRIILAALALGAVAVGATLALYRPEPAPARPHGQAQP